jgi:HlyD family secretion protein
VNRSRWLTVGAVLVVVIAFVAWRLNAKQPPARYRTAVVERGAIEQRVSATGTIRPVIQVQVGSQVSGTVAKLYADYNSRVKQGDVLLQIEPSAFHARVLQSEAAVERAVAAVKDGERQLKRAQGLMKDSLLAQTDLEAAEVTLQQRNADLKQAQAQLEAARVDLANTTIRAPIDGVVISRAIDVGQTVAASLQAPQLFVLGNDLTRMQVETNIDEADIGQVHVGLPVSFTVDAFPDATFQGQVSQVRLEPIVQQGVVTYTTVIGAPNPDLRLRPGMTANVSVLVDSRDDVLKVPAAALRFRPAGESAFAGMGGGGGGAGRGAGGNGFLAGGSMPSGRPSTAGVGGGPATAASDPAGASRHGAWGGGGRGWAHGDSARAGRDAGGAHGWARGDSAQRAGHAGGYAGGWSQGTRGTRGPDGARGSLTVGGEIPQGPRFKPGTIYLLRGDKPAKVRVLTGLSDGTNVEVISDSLQIGDRVITGVELTAATPSNLQPPPGMGGPQFRGPGRPGGGGGGGRR